jgi:Trk-type K+ transport system membrane component
MNFTEIFWVIGIAIMLEGVLMLTALPFAMMTGRLELFSVLLLFAPSFWRQ